VFSISGRGTVVTGRIERGIVKVKTRWRSWPAADGEDHLHGVEMFRKLLDQGQAGDNVGVLLRARSARRSSASGARQAREHHAHTKFEARCTC